VTRHSLPPLHAVTDDRVIAGDLVARARALTAAGGPDVALHLRSRALEGRAFYELAVALREITRQTGAWLVVNGRADVAAAVQADAVVSGRGGLTAGDVRKVVTLPVGRSVHDDDEVRVALAETADFLVAGPVFATASHPGQPAAGVDFLRRAAAHGTPVIAIGGIAPDTAAGVFAAGAHGVAAIRALWDAPDPAAAVRAFLEASRSVGPSVRPSVASIQLNGEPRSVTSGITLAELLASLSLDPRAVVVEHNRRIVRRDGLATATVGDGDSIELVHFVGGG
jgi:thiamine-phosphate pyrophosphorylase